MSGVEAVEYLYGIDSSVDDDSRFYRPPRVVQFRITKKTPKRIYYIPREWRPDEIRFVDRQEIEAAGEVRPRSRSWYEPDSHLYLEPPVIEETRKPDLAELKAIMTAAHPDRGGTDAAFIAARAAYERARQRAAEAA